MKYHRISYGILWHFMALQMESWKSDGSEIPSVSKYGLA